MKMGFLTNLLDNRAIAKVFLPLLLNVLSSDADGSKLWMTSEDISLTLLVIRYRFGEGRGLPQDLIIRKTVAAAFKPIQQRYWVMGIAVDFFCRGKWRDMETCPGFIKAADRAPSKQEDDVLKEGTNWNISFRIYWTDVLGLQIVMAEFIDCWGLFIVSISSWNMDCVCTSGCSHVLFVFDTACLCILKKACFQFLL